MSTPLTASSALRLIETLASASVLLSSLEFIVVPRLIDDTSFMIWPVFRLRHRWFFDGRLGKVFDRILAWPAILFVLFLRLLAALLLFVGVTWSTAHIALLAIITVSTMAMMLRTTYGLEGSDQILLIIFVTLTLVFARPSPVTMTLGLWFLALQACLAYCTAGYYKVASPMWRDGTALVGIFGTRCYGQPMLARYLADHHRLTIWLSRAFAVSECGFPLVLLLPKSMLPYFLAWGIGFHASCAVLMGLNNFLWAFLATYPAVVYCVTHR
jgi:hypothetical protein